MILGRRWIGLGCGTGAVSRCLRNGRPGVAVDAVFRSTALLGDRPLVHTAPPVKEGLL